MPKKGKKNLDDVKMVISALSITATLAMWNIFAATNNQAEEKKVLQSPSLPEPVVVVDTPTRPQPAFTGKILLGGAAPKPRVVVVQAKNNRGNNNNNNNNNGGGGGGPVTSTASS